MPSWLQATQDEVEKTFAINVFSALYMIQAAVSFMPKSGRVVNISSIASKLGVGPIALYSAAKAALDSLAYAAATEVCSSNCRLSSTTACYLR